MGLSEGRKEEGQGKWKERIRWGSTTCKVGGQTERGDIQETDEGNELGDESGYGRTWGNQGYSKGQILNKWKNKQKRCRREKNGGQN